MAAQYLLVVKGKPEGPYSVEQLKLMQVKPGDFVRTETMSDYKEAHEVAELRALLGFSLQAVTPQYFGSFDQRLLASVIDWLIVSGVCVTLALIGVLFTSGKLARIILSVSMLAIIPAAKLVYHVVMEGSAKQATYGKRVLKIRVCSADGSPIGYGQAIARNLGKILSTAPFFIGYLFNFFNKKQQCLHDMLAGTLVIKDRLV